MRTATTNTKRVFTKHNKSFKRPYNSSSSKKFKTHPLTRKFYSNFENPEFKKNLKCNNQKKVSNGRWTKSEHKQFLEAMNQFGHNWRKVEAYMGTRTSSQIRSHAQKYFLKIKAEKYQAESASVTFSLNTSLHQEKYSNAIQITKQKPFKIVNIKFESTIQKLEMQSNNFQNNLKDWVACERDLKSQLELQNEFVNISDESLKLFNSVKDDSIQERCINIIKVSNFGINEIDKRLNTWQMANPNIECNFLVQYMKSYGFNSFDEIKDVYVKLDDWIGNKETRIHEDIVKVSNK